MKSIRYATPQDAQDLLAIYRPYVQDSAISFETSLPSVEEFHHRISETLTKFPWIVYKLDQKIVGYAYAGTYRTRAAYAWSVESTIYIHHEFHGRGIGKELYLKLFELIKAQGVVNVIAGITIPNEPSIQFHEALGFRQMAHLKNLGFKFGRWWDVGFWQYELQPAVAIVPPEPLKAPLAL